MTKGRPREGWGFDPALRSILDGVLIFLRPPPDLQVERDVDAELRRLSRGEPARSMGKKHMSYEAVSLAKSFTPNKQCSTDNFPLQFI